ncbi:MAG: SemiSWEET family transporter [Thermoleophilia bacterium]
MDTTTLLGLGAGALTTGCWVPQLARSLRTRSTGDLSWGYLLALLAGIGLWFAYGAAQSDAAIMVTNGLSLLAVGALSSVKAGVPWPRGAAPDPEA